MSLSSVFLEQAAPRPPINLGEVLVADCFWKPMIGVHIVEDILGVGCLQRTPPRLRVYSVDTLVSAPADVGTFREQGVDQTCYLLMWERGPIASILKVLYKLVYEFRLLSNPLVSA